MKRLKLITAPVKEPFVLSEAKTFLRVDSSSEDSLIEGLIKAARRSVENFTKLALITQTWELWLDQFPGLSTTRQPWWDGERTAPLSVLGGTQSKIEINKGPLLSVVSLTTYNDADTAAVFSSDNYLVSTAGQFGRIGLKTSQIWPTDLRSMDAIVIQFTAGYGTTGPDIPEDITLAMNQLIAHWFEHRESVSEKGVHELPMAVKMLLEPYKVIKT